MQSRHQRNHDRHRRELGRRLFATAGERPRIRLQDISYTYQEGEGGIADALKLAEHFSDGESICVILGDNIVEDDISPFVERFEAQPRGARSCSKKSTIPNGSASRNWTATDRRASRRNPKPQSNYAVTGIYMYDARVFDLLPRSQAVVTRRIGNHRREQRLHRRRRSALRHFVGLVDGRRPVRKPFRAGELAFRVRQNRQ